MQTAVQSQKERPHVPSRSEYIALKPLGKSRGNLPGLKTGQNLASWIAQERKADDPGSTWLNGGILKVLGAKTDIHPKQFETFVPKIQLEKAETDEAFFGRVGLPGKELNQEFCSVLIASFDNPHVTMFQSSQGLLILWNRKHGRWETFTQKEHTLGVSQETILKSIFCVWSKKLGTNWQRARDLLCQQLSKAVQAETAQAELDYDNAVGFGIGWEPIIADFIVVLRNMDPDYVSKARVKHAVPHVYPAYPFFKAKLAFPRSFNTAERTVCVEDLQTETASIINPAIACMLEHPSFCSHLCNSMPQRDNGGFITVLGRGGLGNEWTVRYNVLILPECVVENENMEQHRIPLEKAS